MSIGNWAAGVVAGALLLAAGNAMAQSPSPAGAPGPVMALDEYGHLPAVEHMSLAPAGDKFAFIAVTGAERKLYVTKVGGGTLMSAKVGSAKVRGLEWAGDDYLMVNVTATVKPNYLYKQKQDRFEFLVVMCVNVKTGKSYLVFSKAPKGPALYFPTPMSVYGYRRVDGRWFGYFSGLLDATGGVNLFKVDLETGEGELVARAGSLGREWVVGPDGKVLVELEYTHATQQTRILAGDGGPTIVARHDPVGSIGVGGPGRTAGTFLVDDGTGDRDRIEEISLTAPQSPTLLIDDQQVSEYLHDPMTKQAIGAITDNDDDVVLFDPVRKARYAALRKAFPGLHVRPVSFTPNLEKVIAFTDGGDDAGTYWMVDLTTGQASELIEAYPAVRPANVGPTRMVNYKAADGLALEGVLTLPPGKPAKNLPLILLPHGGPLDARDHVGFDWWAQAFASRGYAVFQPNYRGSNGHGAAFRNAAVGEYGRKMISDMSDGVAALAAEGVVDRRRVCIVGGSYGGYAALAGVILQQDIYRCAVSVGGVSNPGGMLVRTGDTGGSDNMVVRYLRQLMGASFAGDNSLREVSPLFHAQEASAPILLIHGEDDTVVPIKQSVDMDERLRATGKVVEFVRIKDEDHWLSTGAGRLQMLTSATAFLQKYNPAD